jgi:hypothetical protein
VVLALAGMLPLLAPAQAPLLLPALGTGWLLVAPGLLSPEVRVSRAGVELRLTGQPGERYRVEVSPDLVQWAAVSEVTAGAEPAVVRDPNGGIQSQRFYRAVLVVP